MSTIRRIKSLLKTDNETTSQSRIKATIKIKDVKLDGSLYERVLIEVEACYDWEIIKIIDAIKNIL